jgi:hypothetical protein
VKLRRHWPPRRGAVVESPIHPYSANGRFFSKTIRISLGKKDQFLFQGEISLTKIVRPEQNHLPKSSARLMKTLAQRRRNVVDLTKRARRLLKASINLVQQRWTKPNSLKHSTTSIYIYKICPRADKYGFDLISDALPCSPLWYRGPKALEDAIGYAKFFSRSNDAVIRVYDNAGNVIQTHYHEGEFKSGELLLTSHRSSPKANAHDSAFIGDHEARKLITNALNFSSARTTKRFPSR